MALFTSRSDSGGGVSFEELLKTLRAEYLAALPDKIEIISKQITTGNTAELRDSFHKLKGTGKTYGMPEVSDLSEITETICMQKPAQAQAAAEQAVGLLRDIHAARQNQQPFVLDPDPRYQMIRKLLQN
jgi:HPt (histidine-containing phosphotransfer) domain-containing protein